MFFRRKKIFIIDDNAEFVLFLEKILEQEKFAVHSTTKGEGAVELANKIRPDVIILDMMLPDVGGVEIERVLKVGRLTKRIPIIYLTALVSRADEEALLKTGGRRRVLAKPVTKERLLAAIHDVM